MINQVYSNSRTFDVLVMMTSLQITPVEVSLLFSVGTCKNFVKVYCHMCSPFLVPL